MSRLLIFRLTFPILILSGAVLVVAAATGWYVHYLQQSASQFLSRSVGSMRAAEELEIRTREMRTRLHQFVVTGDERSLRVIPGMYGQTLEWLHSAEKFSLDPRELALTSRIRDGFVRFQDEYRAIVEQLDEADVPREELKQQVAKLTDDRITNGLLVDLHNFLEMNQQLIARTIPTNQKAADRVGVGLVLLGLCGALAGLLAGYALARSVSESLVQLSVPVRDAAGKLNEVVGPFKLALSGGNIDELRSALQEMADHIGTVVTQLQQSQREALRAEQLAAVGQLAAGMAHELRNPLTAIKMIVQSATEDDLGGGVRGRDLTVLYEQILRQERVIQSFLEYARPPNMERQRVDLAQVVRTTVHLVSAQAERQRVRIDCHVSTSPVPVEGDAEQLQQVALNLFVNALDALPQGGVIRAELQRQALHDVPVDLPVDLPTMRSQAPEWAVLKVADNGCGLPENPGNFIFEPFYSTKETGMGLGLSICKRIVETHTGQIAARSLVDGGAQFVVCLPLASETPAATAESDGSALMEAVSPPDPRPY